MNPKQKKYINGKITDLIAATPRTITPLTSYLIGRNLLTEDEKEVIDGKPIHHDRAFELYSCITRKGPYAFDILIDGLEHVQALEAAGILKLYNGAGATRNLSSMEVDADTEPQLR